MGASGAGGVAPVGMASTSFLLPPLPFRVPFPLDRPITTRSRCLETTAGYRWTGSQELRLVPILDDPSTTIDPGQRGLDSGRTTKRGCCAQCARTDAPSIPFSVSEISVICMYGSGDGIPLLWTRLFRNLMAQRGGGTLPRRWKRCWKASRGPRRGRGVDQVASLCYSLGAGDLE